ncbi:hypothetical protein Leryth_011713 [Lithospermum erythrorhizon]|nr:hypothetical protein Leryth_011713 [Lithospermum erythrorhizon]
MTSLQLSINFSPLISQYDHSNNKTTSFYSKPTKRIASFYSIHNHSSKKQSFHVCYCSVSNLKIKFLRVFKGKLSFLGVERGGNEVFERGVEQKRGKRVVLVRFNEGFGFNGGGGGGGRDSNNIRSLVNLVLAIVLTYFTMTGQLGWVLDAVVSIWLLAVIVPIAGLGAFLWWAGRDIVQSSCPNCGNDFQVFKSMLNDEVQLCPYCTQPFSVVGDEFVRDPVKFSNQTNPFGQAFSDSSPRPKKGLNSIYSPTYRVCEWNFFLLDISYYIYHIVFV